MGKGDLRTKRGKIWRGTSGKCRPKPSKRVVEEQAKQENAPTEEAQPEEQLEEQPETQPEEQPETQPEEQPETQPEEQPQTQE